MASKSSTASLVFVAMVLLFHPFPASAQWSPYPTPGLPRTSDGKANLNAPPQRMADSKIDLSGVWRVRQATYVFFVTSPLKSSEIQPWAAALYKQRADNFRRDSDSVKCLPPGPRASASAGGFPLKITQNPNLMVMLYEYQTIYRQVFTDGRSLPEDPNPTWMGYSVGRWEADTLVVTTKGFNERSWLDLAGHAHSEALQITERFHRRNIGHMDVEVTYDDPKAYTRPWTLHVDLDLTPDAELIEYVCENERDSRHLVGTRGDEFHVPIDVLARYVGTYDGGVRGTSEITLEDGQLMIEQNGSGKIPLFAHSETVFTQEGTGIEFVKNAQGVVNSLIQRYTEGDRIFTRRVKP